MVYQDFVDEQHAIYFCRFSLPLPDAGPEEDYDAHMQNLGRAVQAAVHHPDHLACVIVHDAGYPPPHAGIRAKLVEFTTQPHFNPIVAFVTPNIAIRGVLTALRWLRQPTHKEKVFANVKSAFDWLVACRTVSMPAGSKQSLLELAGLS